MEETPYSDEYMILRKKLSISDGLVDYEWLLQGIVLLGAAT